MITSFSLRGVADIHVVVVLLMACFTLRTASEEADARTVRVPTSERIVPTLVPTSADNKTTNNSGYSWGPIISSVSNDTTLNIYNDHDKVYLICEASGENITGGYWVRVNDNRLSPNHNKSKMSYYDNGKAIKLTLTIVAAHPSHSGRYRCIVYGQWGMVRSKKVKVAIKYNINLIIEPSKLVFAEGETINIEIKAEGPGKENFTYQWGRDNASLASIAIGENTPSITITSATLSDGGSYYCVVKNEWGHMVESNRSIMSVISVLLKPDHQTEATGQTIELTCKVRGTSIDNLTYQWIIPGSVVVNGSNALTIPNTTVNDSGIYFCIVHAINGSNEGIKSNLANVSILGLPRIIVHPSSTTVAEGSSVVLMCKAAGEGTLNYQWKKVSGTFPERSLGYNDTNLTIFNATIDDSGKYYCKVDNGGASVNSIKSNVIVNGKPIITSVSRSQIYIVTDDDETVELVCKIIGDNITLAYIERLNGTLPNVTNHIINADTNEIVLHMSVKAHPHNSGDFRCIAYSQWGVTSSTIASVSIVAAPPTFTVHPTDKVAIALENITFKAEAKGFRVKFEWIFYNSSGTYPLGTEKTKKSSSILTLYKVTPSNSGHYFCVAKTHGKNHQVFSRNVTLTVNDSFTVKLNSEYIVNINGSVVMNVVSKGPGSAYYKYQWEKMGSDSLPSTASGQDTPNLIINKVKMTDNGSYVCHVRNSWGTTVTSNVASILVLSVELHPLSISVSALGFVNYTCQSSVASSVKYQWVHNDTLMRNESSAVLNITNISWNETGIYHCMVTVMNNVSVESNRGFLNMTSKSVQPSTNKNSITVTTIALICVFSVLATVIFLVLVGCSVCSLYHKWRTNKLQVEGVASVVEMTNQTGQSTIAATGVTVTTLNNSNSSIDTNGNDSGNNSDNGDSHNDNGDDGSGDDNDNINGNINNDSDSNSNGDNNGTGNIINDNGSNDDDIGDNNDSGNIDKDSGSNDNENSNDNNSDDNDNDNKDNCNCNDDNMSSSNNCNNTRISSTNSSVCIKKQTGRNAHKDGDIEAYTEATPDQALKSSHA